MALPAAQVLHFYALSGAAYCDGLQDAWDCLPCRRANVTAESVLQFSSSKDDGHGDLALLRRVGEADGLEIVLGFRGTESWENAIDDLKFAKTDRSVRSCAGCLVHSGFDDVWRDLAPLFVTKLRELRTQYPTAPFYVTGHSLGASVAIIASYSLEADLSISISALFTYGAARVGNREFANATSSRFAGRAWRSTHHHDPVPHLPPLAFGFTHSSRELFFADDTITSGLVCDNTGEDPRCADQYHISAISIFDHLHYFGIRIGEPACTTEGLAAIANRSAT